MATPTIPEYITVHLGSPSSNAANVTVRFADYIKNVASSEIYPTWPESAIRANIYAQISFALNRVYTEYYRSRGYDFDITNSTQYDQSFVNGRDYFANISEIVDEIFNDYVTKGEQVQPYFTSYCNGTTVTCAGLSQWGTVALANQGLTPYQILQRYYGNDINIVRNAPVRANVPSYSGIPLRLGSAGEEVRTIQNQLNRIGINYPAIPRIPQVNGIYGGETEAAVRAFQNIFNLTPDGIVGKATWYKIKTIFNGVKGVSELYAEGLSQLDVTRLYPRLIQFGSSGNEVRVVQYFLAFIGFFNDDLPRLTVDGVFGSQTRDAVLAFQRYYGLNADGIVGRETWNKMVDVYYGILSSLPPEYSQYSSRLYPGYYITTGASGEIVRRVQTWLNGIARNNSAVPSVAVDGVFGSRTANAVRAVQRLNDLPQTGEIGPLTWVAIVDMYYG